MTAPYDASTSTVVALVTVTQSNPPAASLARAASSAGWSSVGAKLIMGATMGVAPRARSAAATPSPQGPPLGTSTRHPASG